MAVIELNMKAPDFTLQDFNGNPVNLSDYEGKKHVFLVLNRGFVCPFCQRHLAQLRQDHERFVERDAEIISIGPENAEKFKEYWEKNDLPFVGLPDETQSVLKRYGQEIKLFKFGRMPAQILVDKKGVVRFVHYGYDMSDIPANEELLSLLDELQKEG